MLSVGIYCHKFNAVNELLNTEVLLWKLRNYTARLRISVKFVRCVECLATSDLSVILSTLVTVQLISAVREPAVTSLIYTLFRKTSYISHNVATKVRVCALP